MKALLKQMSLYISDMRSLQNIVNEFNLFRKVVDDNKNHAKIFSLIFYKNTYAQDYNLTDKKQVFFITLLMITVYVNYMKVISILWTANFKN